MSTYENKFTAMVKLLDTYKSYSRLMQKYQPNTWKTAIESYREQTCGMIQGAMLFAETDEQRSELADLWNKDYSLYYENLLMDGEPNV